LSIADMYMIISFIIYLMFGIQERTMADAGNGADLELSAAVIKAIRDEAIAQVGKWTVGAFVLLFGIAASGWWFYLQKQVDQYIVVKAGGVPLNAVIAIDSASGCSQLGDGWEELKDAAGRVIVGTGDGKDLTSRGFRERLGKEKYRLIAENLPPHAHEVYRHAGKMVGDTGVPGAGSADPNKGSQVLAGQSGDGPGKSEPYEVMPPYISLYYCKKVR
jgi:microcystin-dependent protein